MGDGTRGNGEAHDDVQDDVQDEDGEVAEIDWAILQAGIDAMAGAGLDLDDTETVMHHLTVLLAAFLHRAATIDGLDEMAVGEMAAEMAGAAVEIATEGDDLPAFAVEDEAVEDED